MKQLICATLALVFSATIAAAQCGLRPDMTEALSHSHGEYPTSLGITWEGLLIEMWANPETGTWTALVTRPDGVSCIAAHGQQFRALEPPAPGEDM